MEKIDFKYEFEWEEEGINETYGSSVFNEDAVDWFSALGKFIDFLSGAGYYIPKETKSSIMSAARESHKDYVKDRFTR